MVSGTKSGILLKRQGYITTSKSTSNILIALTLPNVPRLLFPADLFTFLPSFPELWS